MSDFNIIYNTDVHNDYDTNKNKTSKYLTKYEKAKIIGLRAQQIATGSVVFVDVPKGMINSIEIARKELEERKIPFIVKRKIGHNEFEYWKLDDLIY